MRHTAKILEQVVQILNRTHPIVPISINTAYEGYRIETNQGGKDLSPRLKAGEMALWLDGFRAGMDHLGDVQNVAQKEGRSDRQTEHTTT